MKSVPSRPGPLNTDRTNLRNYDRIRYCCRLEYRRRILINLGLHPNDTRQDIRFCNHHKMSMKTVRVSWYNNRNNKKYLACEMNLPEKLLSTPLPISDINKKKNKGTGLDRLMLRYLAEAKKLRESGDIEATALLAMSQVFEHRELTIDTVNTFNENVLETIGIGLPSNNKLDYKWKGKRNQNNVILERNIKVSKYKLNTITDSEVKEFTGFPSLSAMIAFIVVVCGGNIEEMIKTKYDLNWLEEWMLYFERVWGKSCTRWVDCRRKYDISSRCCRRVYDDKRTLMKSSRRSFPRFVTIDEDLKLRKNKWSETYGDRRIIMWDNTDIEMYKPSQAEAQRLTYSQYYASNVGKGSVFIQPCGWMGTGEIWTGGVSDTDYMQRSNILQYQQNYLPVFDSQKENYKWNIITDKGYRITTAAWQCGEQLVIQPAFAKSDKQFTSLQTLRSASVAADRSGNERAVKYAKMCSYVSSGLKNNASADRMCDVWLCWSFQCNFMFRPVH
jgi:DDE superfamily endonuclease